MVLVMAAPSPYLAKLKWMKIEFPQITSSEILDFLATAWAFPNSSEPVESKPPMFAKNQMVTAIIRESSVKWFS